MLMLSLNSLGRKQEKQFGTDWRNTLITLAVKTVCPDSSGMLKYIECIYTLPIQILHLLTILNCDT